MKNYKQKDWVAIIGSREPSEQQEIEVIKMIEELDPAEQCIISGCAYGIDRLALETGVNLGFDTLGILPWPKYNMAIQAYCTRAICIDDFAHNARAEAYDSVKQHHPNPRALSQGAVKLHARNYGIINWASEVIAAPSDKPGGGGTGQGIRLATSLGKKVTIVDPCGGIHG